MDVDDLISETYVTERRREDNREDELLDYVCEDALEVQSEMTIACNGSSDNGLDIDNLPVENEESELIEIDNVAEVDVYTFVGSDEESRSEPECLRIGRFRSFTNKIEENELDDSGSTDTSSGRSSLLVNCQDDSKSSNHPKRGHS